jgi:hypothetical protein
MYCGILPGQLIKNGNTGWNYLRNLPALKSHLFQLSLHLHFPSVANCYLTTPVWSVLLISKSFSLLYDSFPLGTIIFHFKLCCLQREILWFWPFNSLNKINLSYPCFCWDQQLFSKVNRLLVVWTSMCATHISTFYILQITKDYINIIWKKDYFPYFISEWKYIL